jgi:hypothetical protein
MQAGHPGASAPPGTISFALRERRSTAPEFVLKLRGGRQDGAT